MPAQHALPLKDGVVCCVAAKAAAQIIREPVPAATSDSVGSCKESYSWRRWTLRCRNDRKEVFAPKRTAQFRNKVLEIDPKKRNSAVASDLIL